MIQLVSRSFTKALPWVVALALISLPSCNDKLSEIGESIQPTDDVVVSQYQTITLEANTVQSSPVYTAQNTQALIGAISDPAYGDFTSEFATQVRHARGYQFAKPPKDDRIDSVQVRLVYTDYVGLRTAPLQISVYELPKGFTGQEHASISLNQYAKDEALLGQAIRSLNEHREIDTVLNLQRTAILLSLDKELGQRIYNASKATPEAFATPASFSNQVFGGLYFTVHTGSGVVLQVGSVELIIHYTHIDNAGKQQKVQEVFINTKLTPRSHGFKHSQADNLIQEANTTHTFVKGPNGVETELVIKVDQLTRLLSGQKAKNIGKDWTLTDTQLKLTVDNPQNIVLNPPTYMMLMPHDSVANFFKKGQTERTQSASSYLSSAYSVQSPVYDFTNIARLITTHLSKHATYTNGRWEVNKDLEMRVLPIQRVTAKNGSNAVITAEINPYLFPCFVRLKKSAESLKLGVISVEFKK